MTDPQITEEPGLTNESWRPKFYGLIQEGRKIRLSSGALKVSLFVIGLLILSVQVLSSFKPTMAKKVETIFAAPSVRGNSESVYIPPVMSAAKDYEMEKARAREFAQRRLSVGRIEKIKPIKLSQGKGIPSGSEVMTYLASGASNGLVKAVLSQHMKYGGDLVLEKGTTLLGKGTSSEERLYISFTKAVLPDKTEMKIKAFAFDQGDRIIGLKGKKISDYAFRLAASAGLIFLGGVADGLREDTSSNPFEKRKPTTRDAALNGVSTATLETGRDMMDSMKNAQARVEVPSQTPVLVIFGDVND